jgi:NADPH2:quinone reductase
VKAVTIARFGGPEVMEYGDIPPPTPQVGEALVQLEFAGVNFTDVYQRSGLYVRSHTYQTPLPMTLGSEGSGTVVALGDGVNGLKVGERGLTDRARAYAQRAAVPAWRWCGPLTTCRCWLQRR